MPSQEYFLAPTLKCLFTSLYHDTHIGDHPCTEAVQLTLGTPADHNLNQHINQPRRPPTKIHHNPENPTVLHTLRNSRVTTDDPQIGFYSSDDHTSDLEEDSDHLN